jgi:hypothetical protein
VIGGVVVALIVVGAAVLALTGGGGGGGGGGDGSDAAGVELIGFSTAWDGTTCTASWEFGGDAFESGDELWVSADGVVVAKGAALAADSVSGSPRFDSLSLVRDGTVVQRWTPTSAEC